MTARADTTKQKILDSAACLFAEQGFSATSMRAITDTAAVNLAAVNYHFGTKKALIRAVLDQYLQRFMPKLEYALQQLRRRSSFSLTDVFSAFVGPLLELNQFHPLAANRFVQLLSRGYIETQGHLRTFLTTDYGAVLGQIRLAVTAACPRLTPQDYFWRMHFTLGTVVFTMASSQALCDIARADFAQQMDIEQLMLKVVPFLAAGVGAPISD